MFKATTNLFGNDKLVFERTTQSSGPNHTAAKKGTTTKTYELIGSNPVQHKILPGNNFQTGDSRSHALRKVHGSSGMSESLFSGHDNTELKKGNERNKKTEFHYTAASTNVK